MLPIQGLRRITRIALIGVTPTICRIVTLDRSSLIDQIPWTERTIEANLSPLKTTRP